MFEIKKSTHSIRKTDTLHTVLGGEMLGGGNICDIGAPTTEIVICEYCLLINRRQNDYRRPSSTHPKDMTFATLRLYLAQPVLIDILLVKIRFLV